MCRVEERVLDYGVVERRIYDENDQLVDVRKIYPSVRIEDQASSVYLKRRTVRGSSGGHQF